jgi:DNA (cytosine-5)-methyltransferase 1
MENRSAAGGKIMLEDKPKLKVLDLFSGIRLGGFSLGLERTGGFETVAFCEIEPFPRKVLAKHWPEVPCYDDVTKLTGDILARDGIAPNVLTGGFPCQDISIAGRQAGIGEGTRSGLYAHVIRLAGEIRLDYIVLENVSALLSGPNGNAGAWFATILSDLAAIGYDAEWHNIPASALGGAHRRERIWIIAYPKRKRRQRPIADDCVFSSAFTPFSVPFDGSIDGWCRMAERGAPVRNGDGVSCAVDRRRIKSAGNAVVPQIPELIGRAILQAEATQ